MTTIKLLLKKKSGNRKACPNLMPLINKNERPLWERSTHDAVVKMVSHSLRKNAESSSEFMAWFAVQSFYSLLTFCTANIFAPISWQRPTNLQMLFAWEISYQSMPYSTSLLQRKWRGGKWGRSSRSLALLYMWWVSKWLCSIVVPGYKFKSCVAWWCSVPQLYSSTGSFCNINTIL